MKAKFGMGIFTISDASEILQIDRSKIKYWFGRYVSGEFNKKSNQGYFYDSGKVIAVNFLTLIETYVFYQLKEKGVPTKSIVKAHEVLSKYHNTPYPFALEDFLCSGRDLWQKIGDDFISLDEKRQYALIDVILHFSENIDFMKDYASKYYPRGRTNSVVINPQNQYGSPIIDGTNIKASTISGLFLGGEESDFIADLFEIEERKVVEAISFAA
ncbi:MAG: DUF433 domain-containing protein [Cytophagales bacterium]|nr:DUF433 domain-containing protein [Cytophagales bacterium]